MYKRSCFRKPFGSERAISNAQFLININVCIVNFIMLKHHSSRNNFELFVIHWARSNCSQSIILQYRLHVRKDPLNLL